ncbi:monovalent cation/H+ antiporter complex subunit F [Gulosibacter bifidus]|uniref:Monovalent cation/H+ antiporter complex subunit F n=1 Tax=Gulosibacter bifidus TaxID=272239 RepID=A0ABW5RHT9_9MICO|nr:monovalent cation/H+ antiporter complex subunit F [Gulosibacter bifidus]
MNTVEFWMLVLAGIMFASASLMAIVRIVRGPSIVDRVVGSDTLATIVICALLADMTIRGHATTLPLVLGLAMTASIGTMAVARFVSRSRPGTATSGDARVAAATHPQTGALDKISAAAALAEEGMRDQGPEPDDSAHGHDAVLGARTDTNPATEDEHGQGNAGGAA